MSKRDDLFNALKERNLITLYYDRVMFYDEGYGEIQFWKLNENSDFLILENKGVSVYFDKWELSDKCLYVYKNDTIIGSFKLPNEKKIALNHNHFYVDNFAVDMSETLDNNSEKGDWAYCNVEQAVSLLKKNVNNLDNKKDIKKSCVDIANFAMMTFYLS